MTLETTLKNAKSEAFNSLMNGTKHYKTRQYPVMFVIHTDIDNTLIEQTLFKNMEDEMNFIKEISDVHGWLCSKYTRLIVYDLNKEMKPKEHEVLVGLCQNYLE